MAEAKGCARPTGSVIGQEPTADSPTSSPEIYKETKMIAKVGQKAPDFEAPAYHQGKFTTVNREIVRLPRKMDFSLFLSR